MSLIDYIPDFSGDDFANDKEIQRQREALKMYNKMINDSINIIQKELNVQKSSHKNFKVFHMFKCLKATITHSMKLVMPNSELRVSLADYFSSTSIARYPNSGNDLYIFGHISFKSSFPRTYIQKETIKEKIEDLFLKLDVDFPHSKEFSRSFQVLTENRSRLEDLLIYKDLDVLTDFPDLELELFDNSVLFRNSRKAISVEETIKFCELAKTILATFK